MYILDIDELKKIYTDLAAEVVIPEGYATGLMWNDPNLYNFYTKDKLNSQHFANKAYGFFFELGRYMNEKGLTIFDDITVIKSVKELGFDEYYDKYGGFETIYELQEETKNKQDNLEGYILEIKKYKLIKDLIPLYGEKIIVNDGAYNYKKLTSSQILSFWQDKTNQLAMNIDTEIKGYNLLEGYTELIEQLDEEPDVGIPYYNGKLFTDTTNGWSRGTVTMISAFSGNGKTSWSVESLIMSCIKNNEKLVIIGNEMSNKDYQKLLLITIMGSEVYGKIDKKGFNRKNINRGNFTEEEKKKLYSALEWIEENAKNKELIKFIPIDDYRIENVEKIIRYYANRGYFYWIIDTFKPTTSGSNDSRWQRFVEDSEKLYNLAKPDSLNLAMHWNVQSADEALKMRYLDERCLADGRKIKNVVDVCGHFRKLWPDEYEKGKKELKIYKWGHDDFTGTTGKKIVGVPKQDEEYYGFFFSKNRKGQSNVTGLDVLIYKVDFNSNRWMEVGFAEIERDGGGY